MKYKEKNHIQMLLKIIHEVKYQRRETVFYRISPHREKSLKTMGSGVFKGYGKVRNQSLFRVFEMNSVSKLLKLWRKQRNKIVEI